MTPDHRMRRTWLALLVSPLAAPLAMWAGSIARGLLAHHDTAGLGSPVAALLVLLLAFVIIGGPLAYATTLFVVWPTLSLLRAGGMLAWWTASLISAAAGAALLPLYLHLLEPRGTFDFFPGAGAVAGAAIGLAFWWIVRRPESRP